MRFDETDTEYNAFDGFADDDTKEEMEWEETEEFQKNYNKMERYKNGISANWKRAIEAFLEDRKINNVREKTITYYKKALDNYFYRDFISKEKITIKIFSEVHYKAYITHMQNLGLADTTINNRLRALRSLVNFLNENSDMKIDFKIRQIKVDNFIKEVFTEEDLKKLIIPEKSFKDMTLTEHRDYAMINFLIGTGVRIATLQGLRIRDIDFESSTIHLRAELMKGRKYIPFPLEKQLAKILKMYILKLDDYGVAGEDDYLFPNQSGAKFGDRGIEDAVKKYGYKKVGKKNIAYNPHKYRHTFAVQYLKTHEHSEYSLIMLKQLMGHEDITTTMQYLKNLKEDVRRDFFKNAPLESLGAVKKGRKVLKPINKNKT